MKFDLRDLIEVESNYKFNKINMNKLKSVVNWFLFSSADPANISRTLKSLAVFLGLLGVDSQLAEETTNAAVEVVVQMGAVASGISALWFAVEKLARFLKSLLR